MNQYQTMPPTQGANGVGLSQNTSKLPPPNTAKLPTQPGISPAVQALMNAQAQQTQLGSRQPVPGARPIRPGQQFQARPNTMSMQPQDYQSAIDQAMSGAFNPQAAAKPAAYQPPVADQSMPVTTPAPMPPMSRRDQIGMDRARMDPSMDRRMAAFGPRVR
jgi:hypothetical protein